MISILRRHLWFFAAAGLCSWIAAGLPLCIRFFSPSEPAQYIIPVPQTLEIAAFLIFGLALAAAILDRNPPGPKSWTLLCIQSAAMLVMGFKAGGYVLIPLMVLVAWQAALMLSFRVALIWIGVQTVILWITLLPEWRSMACLFTLAIFPALQLFGVFAARLAREAASHANEMAEINIELHATRALLASNARAQERTRISRELHDAWGHHLTTLNLQLEYTSHLASGEVRDNLEEAKRLSKSLLTKVRDVVGTLRVEESCDVAYALQEMIGGLPPQPAVHLNVPRDIRIRSSTHGQVLLRCVQEAVTNAVKHACADNVWIDIQPDENGVHIAVRDDGRGVEAVVHGNGLSGMRARFEELGGRLAIDSKTDSGFSIEGWLPRGASVA